MSPARRIARVILWCHARRKVINAWVVRGVSFYFGYRILHHEIYDQPSAEPLLVFVGLWLCGIAPATFFDQLRKIGVEVGSELAKEERVDPTTGEAEAPETKPEPELKSGDRRHE
jgi:hypothetical protein